MLHFLIMAFEVRSHNLHLNMTFCGTKPEVQEGHVLPDAPQIFNFESTNMELIDINVQTLCYVKGRNY